MSRRRRQILVIVAVAALGLLGGAAAYALASPDPANPVSAMDPAASPDAGRQTAPLIVPRRPGESATITRADQIGARPSPRYNTLDAWYVRMMIPHHTQALQMAALAADRAGDRRIVALAERIRASQAPEILQMRGWLQARGLALDDDRDGTHTHGTMRGMQTSEAMRDLAMAEGATFDRLFVEMMTEHHQGAIEMSTDVLRVGVDLTIEQMANSMAAEQAVEIDRMRELVES